MKTAVSEQGYICQLTFNLASLLLIMNYHLLHIIIFIFLQVEILKRLLDKRENSLVTERSTTS